MTSAPDLEGALRKQREAFADVYAADPKLAEQRRRIDEMYMYDEAEPVKDYASRRGE